MSSRPEDIRTDASHEPTEAPDPEADASEVRSPWQSRPFRVLLAGQTTSAFGNALSPVAVAFAVLHLGGSASQLGLVVAAYALAQVLVTLLGGVLGDRLPRAVLMQGSAIACATVQASLSVALLSGRASIPLIGVAGFLAAAFAALSNPSSKALIGQVVPRELLGRAISWRRLASNTAMVAGFASAGMLVAAYGPGWAIALDAVSFVAAAACYALVRVPPVAADPPPGARRSLLADAREGAAEVLRHTWLWVLIAQAMLYHLVYGGAQDVLGPIVVLQGWGEAAWGWSMAALLVGFIVGGALTFRWRPRRTLYAATLLLALTACFPAALAAGASLWLVIAGAFLHGLGLEVFSVNWDVAIQQNVAADRLARVYAFDVAGSFVARPIGLALTGPVAQLVGLGRWLWVVAAVILGSTLLVLTVPSVRRLVRSDLPGDSASG